MSGDTEELAKLFTYKVCRTGGFNKYNKFGNSIWLSDSEFDEKMVVTSLVKAIEDGIKMVDAILGQQNFGEDAYGITG
jgi:autonomous glycyl radical cofactor GrcA